MTRKIVIIGGGPAGIEAGLTAKQRDTDVTIISDGPIGGRAGWHSLLPSKVWLSTADEIARYGESVSARQQASRTDLSPERVVQRIKHVKRSWNEGIELSLQQKGVERIEGKAAFVDDATVEVRDDTNEIVSSLEADAYIIATGSVPIFPPGLKPDGRSVIAPRFASHLNKLPQSMIVVGAGATGCESAYLFNQYGVDVTWIVDQFGILSQFNPDLGRALGIALVRQGIRVVQGQMVERLERDEGVTAVLSDGAHIAADMAFVAIGRRPDWDGLNLAAAALSIDSAGQISTDVYGRTENERIYLVGDAAGGAMVANKAMAQSRIAGSHAVGIPVDGYDPALVVQVTYTEPQAAQLGDVRLTEGVKSARIPYSAALKAHFMHTDDGFLEIFYGETDRQLRGAVALGSHAADVLTPLVVALRLQATVDQIAAIYAPHPTLSELPFIAAREASI